MAGSVKIASFWRLKINIALFENLYAEKGFIPSDHILGIPFTSGFYVHAYHRDKQQRFKAFLPEAAVISMRDLLPNLHMRILDSQTNSGQRISQEQETLLYRTPIPFYSCSGMNAADLLVNHFTEPEMRDLRSARLSCREIWTNIQTTPFSVTALFPQPGSCRTTM